MCCRKPFPGIVAGLLLLALGGVSCDGTAPAERSAPAPVTAMLGHWSSPRPYELLQQSLGEFTGETGVAVNYLPAPGEKPDRLDHYLAELAAGKSVPDVYQAELTEIGRLAPHMIDLAPYLTGDEKAYLAPVLEQYRIDGRLVALPLYTDIGVLLYRTDLLERYGYREPPGTWDELERMAAKIQAGERARGEGEFWGFAWPGAPDDDLLCFALELQASHGGGSLVAVDKTIGVDNPGAARAFTRARRWVGTVSPAGIAAYTANDARNLWYAGRAAFLRSWPHAYADSQADGSVIRGKVGITVLPSGGAGHFGTLGGWQLSVSRYSKQPEMAARFVQVLTRREAQKRRAIVLSGLPPAAALYDDPEVVKVNPYFPMVKNALLQGTVERPSARLGDRYEPAVQTYTRAVHTVLTGEKTAAQALSALQRQLVELTGAGDGAPPRP